MIVYRAQPESLPVGRFLRLPRLHPLLGERAGVRASHLPNCILYLPLKPALRPQTVYTLNRYLPAGRHLAGFIRQPGRDTFHVAPPELVRFFGGIAYKHGAFKKLLT